MRVAYLTTDDVNPALVRTWAAARSVRVNTPRPTTAARSAAGVVIDFDHLPDHTRRAWERAIRTEADRRPVLIHGHNIPDRTAAALRRAGGAVVTGCLHERQFAAWLTRPLGLASRRPATRTTE